MRVLLARAGALGDILLLRGAIAGLKDAGHDVSLLAPSHPASALRGPGPGGIRECLDWEGPAFVPLFQEEGGSEVAELAERLRPLEACIAYTRRGPLIRNLERLVPRVIGWPPAPDGGGHAARFFAEPIRSLGAVPPERLPALEATADERAQAETFLAGRLPPGFLAFHPGSGSPSKNWPPDRFAALARALGPERFLLVEGPADTRSAGPLAAVEGAIRARGLPLRTLGAILAQAGLYVGNDSGVSHLAAAWGAPTIALFGPTDPGVWSPQGEPVVVLRAPTSSLHDLTVAEVARAARSLRAPPQVRGARTSSRLIRR